jgi:putative Mg2+ transporter-C (MgtC) family protein
MLVSMGAALTMILSIYLTAMTTGLWGLGSDLTKTDVSRFGAQVINGIGFLGAGTIIITGRQQVKGLTTAAGLWASACMGLAIGVGFYTASFLACVLILITIVVFSKLESFILSHSRNINLFVEYECVEDVGDIITTLKSQNVRIFDVEITKGKYAEGGYPTAIISMQLPRKATHTEILTILAQLDSIRMIEEL